VVIIILSMIIL